jgi:hypothetical protein
MKVAVARSLRRETTADNPSIARRLRRGRPNYVSNSDPRERDLYPVRLTPISRDPLFRGSFLSHAKTRGRQEWCSRDTHSLHLRVLAS